MAYQPDTDNDDLTVYIDTYGLRRPVNRTEQDVEEDIHKVAQNVGAEVFDVNREAGDPIIIELMDLEEDLVQQVAKGLRSLGYAVQVTARDQLEILGLPHA